MAYKYKTVLIISLILEILSLLWGAIAFALGNTTSGIVLYALCVPLFLVAVFMAFYKMIPCFPLNAREDYRVNVKNSCFCKEKKAVIKVEKLEKSVYLADVGNDVLIFYLKGLFFKKRYICSYFSAVLNYEMVKKEHMPLEKIRESYELSDEFSREVEISFEKGNHKKIYTLVKNGRTLKFPLKKLFIRGGIEDIFYVEPEIKGETSVATAKILKEKLNYQMQEDDVDEGKNRIKKECHIYDGEFMESVKNKVEKYIKTKLSE